MRQLCHVTATDRHTSTSSRAQNDHVIVSIFPFDHHHLPMPRGITRSCSVGNATLREVMAGVLLEDLLVVVVASPPFISPYLQRCPESCSRHRPTSTSRLITETHSMPRAGRRPWKGSGNTIVYALDKSKLGYR
ncbi:hypothetical protein K435DRAFT_165048 [Dendrothele bispora CBS 962.96]|uniref:Uncharacterized protein n=1 Tax=Dendrothele bispora (strain CBS 962.96) TaxID=1314807 RepID=A0A4S8LXV9_DENBC|nr:hypothetical protein K435DRAFT_165048 [Dendrothele bispora CBS 962.96]